jgi:predicted dehydrogenase
MDHPHTFLIAGLGSIGQRHVRNLRQLGANQIVALRSGAGVRPVPPELGVVSCTQLDEALAHTPDIGLVCNPTSLHIESARAMLAAGLDVLVEKPISHNLIGVEELIRFAHNRDRLLSVAYPLRYHPHVKQISAWVAEGRLGAVRYARASVGQYPPAWMPQYDYRQSYAVRQDLGGGCLLTLIHEIDLSDLQTDAEDMAEVIFGYAGFIGSVHIDFVQKSPVHSRYLQIVGERAAVWLDFITHTMSLSSGGSPEVEQRLDGFDPNSMHLDELADFIASVEAQAPAPIDPNQALIGLKCVLAAKESAAAGRTVTLE